MEQLLGAIPSILKGLGDNDAATEALVFAAWKRTAGELLSERTAAVEFAEARLVVAVQDITWQRHLEDLAPQMLARLNGKLGEGAVKFIEFRIDPLAIASRTPLEIKPADSSYLIPNSVEAAAEQIADESLKQQFIETAAAYLAAQK